GEPLSHRVGDGRTDAFDRGQLIGRRGGDRVQAAELGGQCPCRGWPDVANRQPHQPPPQRLLLRGVQVGQQSLAIGRQRAAFGGEQLRAQQVVFGEGEQITLVVDHLRFEQRSRSL